MLRRFAKGLRILRGRIDQQGFWVTLLWAADHGVRRVTGAPIRRYSQITPHLHVGGQYRQRGWPRLAARGITAVVNMRSEFDDNHIGLAPPRYLHLPTVDDTPPALADLHTGVAFVAQEIDRGGGVYIHCAAGVGRAPTMAAAYLASTGVAAGQAWERIRAVRPFIRPTPAQIEQVRQFAAS